MAALGRSGVAVEAREVAMDTGLEHSRVHGNRFPRGVRKSASPNVACKTVIRPVQRGKAPQQGEHPKPAERLRCLPRHVSSSLYALMAPDLETAILPNDEN